jgi:aryl-alcohol dehydrogenase-like predicted oxidoreductase
MDYRFLGRTGLRVSAICFGCMTFEPGYTNIDEGLAFKLLDSYVEAGGNYFDMADNYPGVEEIFGHWLKSRGNRKNYIIATKVRFPVGNGPNDVGLTRKHIIDSLENSLKKIGTDYVDLLQAHCWDQITPIEETLRVFNDLVAMGKVRYVGASNFSGWQMAKSLSVSNMHDWVSFSSLQIQYNLLTRSPEWEIIPACEDYGVSITSWSPLAAGWLTGKYQRDQLPPSDSRMAKIAKNKEEWDKILKVGVSSQIPHPTQIESEEEFQKLCREQETERRWRVIDAVGDIAKARGKSYAQVALAWLLAQPSVCAPIIGVSNLAQLADNLGALGWKLEENEIEWLNRVSNPGLPYPFDFFKKYGVRR